MARKTRQELGYVIPVKIPLEPGRFKYGWVQSLTPNARGNLKIYYGSGRISERAAETCIHEPKGFNVKTTPNAGELL